MALTLVWSPASVLAAVIGGAGVGFFLCGPVASTYTTGQPGVIGRLAVSITAFAGVVFYVGQAVATWADGDPAWPRVVSRFGIWMVYALVLGIATWLRLRILLEVRRRKVMARAQRELDR